MVASTFASGQSALANRLTSVRYFSTSVRLSVCERILAMRDTLLDRVYKRLRLPAGTCGLPLAESTVPVVCGMAKILDNRDIPCENGRELLTPSCEFAGEGGVETGVAPHRA